MGMVVGKGAIANRFVSYNLQSACLIFAGSVHSSSITDVGDIAREEEAIQAALSMANDKTTFIYFSSCSIDDLENVTSPYIMHKKRMEKLIHVSTSNYLIFRLPQVVGFMDIEGGLVNSLVKSIRSGERFELWRDISRNFIDLDHVYRIVHTIIQEKRLRNSVINVASPSATLMPELVRVLEEYFGTTGNYEVAERGTNYQIDVSAISDVILRLGIDFGPGYLSKAIHKYYSYLLKPSPLLSIIVPTYNQVLGVDEFFRRTKAVLSRLEPRFKHELIFVNDCSTDDTYIKLMGIAAADPVVKIVNFARNFGNQIAITAGVKYCRGDLAIIIDDDLQDPPEIMLDFIARWSEGYKVVYGVRPKRQGVNPLFKLVAKLYYRIIGAMSDTPIPKDTGDFRLVDKVVIDQLRLMREENRYYRGMVAWVGFRQTGYVYDRDKRYAGISNFSFGRYLNFALNGLTSFTDKPLYFSSLLGFVITVVSFVLATYLVVYKLLNPEVSIRGWTSMITITMFFGGIQLCSMGVVGIYISKIYREVKQRPLFIVQDLVNIEQDPSKTC